MFVCRRLVWVGALVTLMVVGGCFDLFCDLLFQRNCWFEFFDLELVTRSVVTVAVCLVLLQYTPVAGTLCGGLCCCVVYYCLLCIG